MAIFYLEQKPNVADLMSTVQAGVASLQYFEKMDAICDQVGFSLDDAVVLQRISEMATGRYVQFKALLAAGFTKETLLDYKAAGLLMGMRDTEHGKHYVMLTPKAANGLQAIAATFDQQVPPTPKLDVNELDEIMAAANKVFQKYQ